MKKQSSIPEELFLSLTKLVLLEVSDPELLAHCQQGIREKFDAMARHDLYTQYKTAASPEEREKARQAYLNSKGIPAAFRWKEGQQP